MFRKIYTHDFSKMTDRELYRAFGTHLTHAEICTMKGSSRQSGVHVRVARAIIDEFFLRVEKQLDDFGDNPLDRRPRNTIGS